MSLLDKASLVQIPSGYKATKLYSVVPDSGAGDFTFARSSSGTRINSEGLIEVASVLGNEEIVNGDFATDSDWTKGAGWTISGGKATKSGTDLAYLTQSSLISVIGKTYRVKASITNVTNGNIRIDNFTSGTTYTSNVEIDITYTATSAGVFRFLGWGGFDGSIDNVSVKEVIENDVPRLDYSGGSCASLLLEGQSTNLVTYSEDYSHSSWTKVNASVSSNTTTSPSGATNASTLVSTSGTSEQYLDVGSLSVTSGEDYTMSVFVKKNSYDFFLIRFTGVGGAFSAGNVFFNINNGTLGTVDSGYTGSIESFGNGWYRCSATKNASGTTASGKVRLQLATSDNTESITGDGSSGTFIYGSQFEQSSFATSYIPSNSGSSTTRTDESFVADNLGTIIGQTEGCIFIDFIYYEGNRFEIFDASSTADGFLIYRGGTAYNLQVGNGGSYWAITNMVTGLTIGTRYKLAINYKLNDYKVYVNGSQTATSTSIEVPTTNKIISSQSSGANKFTNNINQFIMFDEKLTDAELTTLTTI